MGTSPDGNSVIVSNDDWVGPYHRGGRRVGLIVRIDLKIGKKRTLVKGLISEGGRDWRQKSQ